MVVTEGCQAGTPGSSLQVRTDTEAGEECRLHPNESPGALSTDWYQPPVLTEDDLRVKNIARVDIENAIPRILTDLTLHSSGHWFLLDTESAFQTSSFLTGLVSFLLL